MDNKLIGFLLAMFVIGLFFLALSMPNIFNKDSPSYDNPQTLDELKEAISSGQSEYYKCLDEVEVNQIAKEKCIRDKMKERGFYDNIKCIEQQRKPAECKVEGRYNAEIYSSNECLDLFKDELSEFDCINLLGK